DRGNRRGNVPSRPGARRYRAGTQRRRDESERRSQRPGGEGALERAGGKEAGKRAPRGEGQERRRAARDQPPPRIRQSASERLDPHSLAELGGQHRVRERADAVATTRLAKRNPLAA